MIKNILIPTALALVFASGCNGWFEPCTYPGELYCTLPNGDDYGPCGEGRTKFYVWFLTDGCQANETSVCATDDADAQSQVDNGDLKIYIHGKVSTDENLTRPTEDFFCPTGSCIVGSEDGSALKTFFTFSDDQIQGCEDYWDADHACTWPQTENTCGASL